MKIVLNKELPIIYKKIFFIITCMVSFPFHMFKKPMAGIDPSWSLSINLAIKNGFVWGKDYIFSYGPLGYLSTGISDYVSKYQILTFYILIWISTCFILYKLFDAIKVNALNLIIGLLSVFTLCNFIEIEASTTLLLNCIFWMFYAVKKDHIFYAAIAVALSILMFFIKLDSGIVINIFMLFFFIYQWFYSSQKKYYSLLFIVNYLLLYLFCISLNVDVINYLISNSHVIGAYNDAMFIPNNPFILLIGTITVCCFIIFTLQNLKQILSNKASILYCLLSLMALYILFKHGYVRHYGYTFIHPPAVLVIALFLYYFIKPAKPFYLRILFYLLIPTSIGFSLINTIEDINISTPKLFATKVKTLQFVSHTFLHKDYVVPAKKLTGIDSSIIPCILPSSIKHKIGNGSVDVIPYMVSTVFFNNLNYNPRPGIQTYADYDEYLDNKGAEKYQSKTAPDFIMYCANNKELDAAIDGRYPFFDEPKTKLAILTYYNVIDSFSNQLLLERNKVTHKVIESSKVKSTISFNQKMELDTSTNQLQWMKVEVKYNLLAKLIRFIYQPPLINITFYLTDGKVYTFRAIKTILEEGVLVNKFIVSNTQAAQLINGHLNEVNKVKAISFGGDKWGLNPLIEISTQNISIQQ